ncbi:MAG TPA: flagellar hook-associated protein FlgK [Phycisphaerales bacterium]|nr:flagellar hook-associated protein FlgK [Phycisphaerales bacterium]
MSLNGALQIGRSAMVASQAAIQVAGNNMANAATPGYHRQSVSLAPSISEQIAQRSYVGTGVNITSIHREIDTALQSRLRTAVSQEQSDLVSQRFLTELETLQNELSDTDVSSTLSDFFNSFSELANNPEDHAVRTLVIQQGQTLANKLNSLRGEYTDLRKQVDQALGASVSKANDILDKLATLNDQIATAEGGQGEIGALRDQRDSLLDDLAQYLDITTIEHTNGTVDVLSGSEPILLGSRSRGLEVRVDAGDDQPNLTIRVREDGTLLNVTSGSIGGLMVQREQNIEPITDDLDTFTGQLIFQLNRVYSQGQGQTGFESAEGTYRIDDTTANLNSTDAGLAFTIGNGSFFINVTNQQTGLMTTHEIHVNGNADSLDDLIDEINNTVGVPNVTASISATNHFTLTAADGYEISFSDDSSGALAALGVNTFFTGENAADIGVNQVLQTDPSKLAAGGGNIAGSNTTALAIADLQDSTFSELGNQSLREFWQKSVDTLAVKTDAANSAAQTSQLVRQSLDAQVQAVSGVSLDEESINLLTFQRQFQAAARFINVINDALQTLLSIVQ